MLLSKFIRGFHFIFLFIIFSAGTIAEAQTTESADSLFSAFMKRWNITGGSMAISKQGQFVYQKGLGYKDPQRLLSVETDTRFRIASLSKCLTATAIMKLVEGQRLNLNQKVFGKNGLLDAAFYQDVISDAKIYDITVQNLLEHTAGWDRLANEHQRGAGDPPFIPLYVTRTEKLPNPVSDSALIRYALRRGPDYQPGTAFAYSNIGYLMLGKIIEKISGRSYESFLQQEVFLPLGLRDFVLGKTKADLQMERESFYFSDATGRSCYGDNKLVSAPYGAYNVEAMNAHGGWIGTAAELCLFINNLNGYTNRSAVLQSATLKEMLKAGNTYANYAKGWFVNSKGTFWHTGSLDGTASFMGTTKNGYCWTFLFNGRGDNSPQFWKELDALPWDFLKISPAQSLPNNAL